ncbi:YhjD/YihY/BrkB family envelope integrity protein [Kitasatospora sp. NPDC056138]|uniref:YhjD/YihY/BrkB family envelope integrity protein n=1 Tax=Kitasatospora sp. NPDC056138 TaxID=3345724 RepID=UPI0035D70AEA
MNPLERILRAIDRAQQRRVAPAFLFGVIKKYGDDRGGLLAALITYFGFVALIPLLLLLSTVLGFVLYGHPGAQEAVLDSALADFPIIGDQLRQNVHSVRGSGLALVIALLGLLYGTLGIAQVLQFTMAQVWNVPGVHRPGYFPRLGRSLLLFVALGTGLLVSTAAATLVGTAAGGLPARICALLLSALLNTALCLACFRVLTPKDVAPRALLPGCVLAGPLWTVLQVFGGLLVAHSLRHATQIYGFFATVIGLLSWLFLSAQVTVYAAEVNVVLARRLWPRSILQPPLTGPDRLVLAAIARQEERRPEQHVKVVFDDLPPTGRDSAGCDPPDRGQRTVVVRRTGPAAFTARRRPAVGTVREVIDVDVPLHTAYLRWTRFEEFPRFMAGVEEVRQLDDRHHHWRTSVAGVRREFDTEIVDRLPDERVAWRTVGSELRRTGVVTFRPLDERRTRVRLVLRVEPGGAAELDADVPGVLARRIRGDLRRFKGFAESGGEGTRSACGRISPS